MELANLTYRSSDDRNSVSDSEASPRKQIVSRRNVPIYLLEPGRLPGIPKGKKVRKKKAKTPVSNSMKSYDFIDTNRTDFSKMTSDYNPFLDTTRTDDSGLEFSFTNPMIASSRTTPYNFSADPSMDFPELHVQTPVNHIKLAHGLHGPVHARRQTKSEMGMSFGKTRRSDPAIKGGRRSSHEKLLGLLDSKPSGSAPAADSDSSKRHQQMSRLNKSSQGKRSALDNADYEPNPDVVPYQPANFMSSTILKKVPIPKRHLDTFGGYEYNFVGRRGVMLHTDRYQVDFIKSFDGMTQRERLQAGLDYIEAMRGTRRKREMVPHRAQLDLIMGGKQIEFEERFDIAREIQKLKCIAMPKNAKDLFHGRGIYLPSTHHSFNPRFPHPSDFEDEKITSSTLPSNFARRAPGESSYQETPKVDREPTSFLKGGQSRTTPFNKLAQLPAIGGQSDAGLHKEGIPSLSRSHTQAPPNSREPSAWTANYSKPQTKASTDQRPDKTSGAPMHVQINRSETQDGKKQSVVQQETESAIEQSMKLPHGEPTKVPHGEPMKMPHGEPMKVPHGETDTGAKRASVSSPVPSHAPSAAQSVVLPQAVPTTSESRVRPTTEEGQKAPTPHPLRGTDLITSVPQDEQELLRQTFQRLDTDADGHIKYNQLKTQLPKKFTSEQERFIEEVYNLTNSITFFGIDEFMVMNRLSKTVENLTGRAEESYEALEFATLPQELLKYIGKFDEGDTSHSGKIDTDGLQRILADTVDPALTTDSSLWDEIIDSISVEYTSQVSKVVFIAHIPLFLSLEQDFRKS